jgi:hypothetical protein
MPRGIKSEESEESESPVFYSFTVPESRPNYIVHVFPVVFGDDTKKPPTLLDRGLVGP